ncbi:MAG: dihydropteroate synthase [Bacteroidota bacterium]
MKPLLINCRGKLLDISSPVVMGILNSTPDSFYDGGKFNEESDRKARVEKMLSDGAAIIDIGAVSSRPGAADVSEKAEWERLIPVLLMMQKYFPDAIVSVDTFRATIAKQAMEEGASVINDITAGKDPEMLKTVAAYHAPYIMMHMQGNPETMQKNPQYEDVTKEVMQFFVDRVMDARSAGINDIIIDPGFGFGKNADHNFSLLKHLGLFKVIGPVMAGLSRKSVINKTLQIKAAEALNGTTVLNTIALMNGACILRVHDVKEAVECVKLVIAYKASI